MSTTRSRMVRVLNQAAKASRRPPVTNTIETWKIVRGDKVQVVGDHREKGKQGIVQTVIREKGRVIVGGVNVGKKMLKGNPDKGIKGRMVERERPIPYCNINLVDPITGNPTKVTRQVLEDGSKVRVAKKSGAVIPRPEQLKFRKRPVNTIVTESDTTEEDAWEITYLPKNSA